MSIVGLCADWDRTGIMKKMIKSINEICICVLNIKVDLVFFHFGCSMIEGLIK